VSNNSNKVASLKTQVEKLQKRIEELEANKTRSIEAKRSLEEEQKFSESIIASLPGLFFMVDENGLYQRWNKNLEKMLGYSAGEIKNRDCRDFVPQRDKARITEAMNVGFEKGTFTLEYCNRTKDGRNIPFFAKGVGVRIDGRPYIIGVEIDLSELKEAERALRESEEHLLSLMETATNFAVYRLAFERGDPNRGRVVFVSPSIKDILGVKKPEDLEDWFENIHIDDVARVKASHFTLPRSERADETMRILHPKTREIHWVQFLSSCINDDHGRLKWSNGIIFDITERVRAVEELKGKEEELQRKTEKLAKLNTALQVLVEHREQEIKDIECSILHAVERLIKPYIRDFTRSGLTDTQRTSIEIIEANIDKVTSPLTKKLSAWHRHLSPTEVKVVDLIRNGKGSKEIANFLGVSGHAVNFHRKNIRLKLGLTHQKINLASYLQSLDKG
jgi:PAS domain S-box-containing protein